MSSTVNLPLDLIRTLQQASPADAWAAAFTHAWGVCSPPFDGDPHADVARRDGRLGDLDLYLATAGWDAWREYEAAAPLTAAALVDWWKAHPPGRAVLILDALSLREVPWLLAGASARGYTVHDARPTGAELPADTTPFARALGFAQRSSLGNNAAGNAHRLPGARTETADIPWRDCAAMIGAEPDWVFWHAWPDSKLHAFADPGEGLKPFVAEVAKHLAGEDFWSLIHRLTQGRRLILTGDHGYADSGRFVDADDVQKQYLQGVYQSGRSSPSVAEAAPFVPPIDLVLDTRHGRHGFVNGRRKWKSPGGYPTLTHGGLTVLEAAVPFIELSRKQT